MDYKQLEAFAAVIEEQNFARAAARLNVTQSAISQRVKQLEEIAGHALLIRTQPITPTDAGRIVLKHFRQLSLLRQSTFEALDPERTSGYNRLSIGINADSLASWFIPAVENLIDTHRVLLDVKVDDQDETLKMLQHGEVVGCITSSNKPLQGCHCIPLGVCEYYCVAAPSFKDAHFSHGVTENTLLAAPGVEFNNKDGLHHQYLDTFFGVADQEYYCHRIPSAQAYSNLLVAGKAYGLLPSDLASPLIKEGKLVNLTPSKVLDVPLYWHLWNLKSPLMRALTHAIEDTTKTLFRPL